jgi:glycosyltransferase involved in cell wall biosynthesis
VWSTGIGAGNKNHIFREAKTMNLSDQIIFTGFIEQDKLINLYLSAKAILSPSLLGITNMPPL